MSNPIRFLIAAFAGVFTFFLASSGSATSIESAVLNIVVAIVLAGAVFFAVIVLIKTEKEAKQDKDAVHIEEFHANGKRKLTGLTIYGKKEREWKYYDENGKLIKKEVYNSGYLMRTVEGDDL